ncbi:MAG: hypothetical protein PVJ73_15195 [Acidobacteriota bacterium]|jgi:hypothetical protein
MTRTFGTLALGIALALGGHGCDDESPTAPDCTPVDLQPQKQTIVLGETASVTALGGDGVSYEFGVEPDVPGEERKTKGDPRSDISNVFLWRPTTPNPGPPDEVYATITVTSCMAVGAPVSDTARVYLLNE